MKADRERSWLAAWAFACASSVTDSRIGVGVEFGIFGAREDGAFVVIRYHYESLGVTQ